MALTVNNRQQNLANIPDSGSISSKYTATLDSIAERDLCGEVDEKVANKENVVSAEEMQQLKDLALNLKLALKDKEKQIAGLQQKLTTEKETEECCICLEDLKPGLSSIFIARCGHWFHHDCIKAAFRAQKKDPSCPLCRRPFRSNEVGMEDKKAMSPPCTPQVLRALHTSAQQNNNDATVRMYNALPQSMRPQQDMPNNTTAHTSRPGIPRHPRSSGQGGNRGSNNTQQQNQRRIVTARERRVHPHPHSRSDGGDGGREQPLARRLDLDRAADNEGGDAAARLTPRSRATASRGCTIS
uniref:RING-type domain-containing protein n=1 Tax=Palpitomonas bilix TaxID=652834 RepID=A0A7S3GFT8_9EUKA|mmetsp:Transcript_4758/g.9963  ORF Transcript_4758/g.9963 Transcript_4758/m.9963 type:complete len:299 (+) Transcript_4758:325-1221(+)|eukprot:CAMPEP_0113917210 /NCGR_PEP_ID=MMETSP0780_2-20120614/32594_1 /TAXON_ID=652834 /ORGANISM="Palpitomonas bilix" /LENGTH=298 /DNA_ID=CAMNT_0000916731 /DNA_START=210 /DNA_END=1106 /DNA_ORIENTATION=+ /assembly_acc=CAM_ASM_000599